MLIEKASDILTHDDLMKQYGLSKNEAYAVLKNGRRINPESKCNMRIGRIYAEQYMGIAKEEIA